MPCPSGPRWSTPTNIPFIILIADSSRQATLNICAIKHELETNNLIKQDYGEIKGNVIEDFALKGEGEEWQKQNIVLSNGVRILARSPRPESARPYAISSTGPKLVVVDDPEDGEWVRTKENRDKTDRWIHSEIMPASDAPPPILYSARCWLALGRHAALCNQMQRFSRFVRLQKRSNSLCGRCTHRNAQGQKHRDLSGPQTNMHNTVRRIIASLHSWREVIAPLDMALAPARSKTSSRSRLP